jgi:hypothetical protein
MGCWNGTCMISNLPIISGERIKLVILRGGISRKACGSAYVYSHDMFTPSFFPISGVYNDYGMIEGCDEDWNYILIEQYFKKLFGNKIIADGKTIEDYSLIDILDGIERGDLKYYGKPNKEMIERKAMAVKAVEVYSKDGFSSEKIEKEWRDLAEMDISETLREANLSFVMIREDIWNHICDKYVGQFYNRDAKSTKDPDFYLTAKRYCQIEFEKGLSRALKLAGLLNVDKSDEKALEEAKKELQELLTSGYALGIFTRQNLDFITPELYDAIAINGDEIIREDILKRYTEFTCISSFLSETRKGWMIQAGAGSQHDGWETHLMLAEKLVDLCKEKIKEYSEDNE